MMSLFSYYVLFPPVPPTVHKHAREANRNLYTGLRCACVWMRVVVCLSVRPCNKRVTCPGWNPAFAQRQLGLKLQRQTAAASAGGARIENKWIHEWMNDVMTSVSKQIQPVLFTDGSVVLLFTIKETYILQKDGWLVFTRTIFHCI